MASAEGMIVGAGALAFAGSFKEAKGFPSNGYSVIAATIVLTFVASFAKDSVISGPVKAAAGLTLLASAIRYVPGLASDYAKKGKNNG